MFPFFDLLSLKPLDLNVYLAEWFGRWIMLHPLAGLNLVRGRIGRGTIRSGFAGTGGVGRGV